MKKLGIIMLLFASACSKVDDGLLTTPPVISFALGRDPYTNQPTFITSDTTVRYGYGKMIGAQFAAAGTLKHVEVRLRDTVVFEDDMENETEYNKYQVISVKPNSNPETVECKFFAEDWNGKTTERTLKVTFQ